MRRIKQRTGANAACMPLGCLRCYRNYGHPLTALKTAIKALKTQTQKQRLTALLPQTLSALKYRSKFTLKCALNSQPSHLNKNYPLLLAIDREPLEKNKLKFLPEKIGAPFWSWSFVVPPHAYAPPPIRSHLTPRCEADGRPLGTCLMFFFHLDDKNASFLLR